MIHRLWKTKRNKSMTSWVRLCSLMISSRALEHWATSLTCSDPAWPAWTNQAAVGETSLFSRSRDQPWNVEHLCGRDVGRERR